MPPFYIRKIKSHNTLKITVINLEIRRKETMEKAVKKYWPIFVLPTVAAFIIGNE